MENYFDQYPEFYEEKKAEEGGVNSYPNRLNRRYSALIENNKKIIDGKRILDIASYDGRWSFAALEAGAKHVFGIELQHESVKQSFEIMKKYGIPEEKYNFVEGDVEVEMKKISEGAFDTIFCLGFFYHTLYHMKLLDEIKRLNPENIIFDTHISTSDNPIIELKKENVRPGGLRGEIYPTLENQILVGWPSKSALELMLTQIGYTFEYYDWHEKGIKNWEWLIDYKKRIRVTLTAKRKK